MRTKAGRVSYLFANREISRFPCKERLHMPRSTTAPGRSGTRLSVPDHVAFHRVKSVGTRDDVLSRLHYLAYAIPCERFKLALAGSPCITRGQGDWLGLSLSGTCTPYSLPVSRRTDTRPKAALITRPRSVLEARVAKDGSDGRVGFEHATGEHLGGGTDIRSRSETYV